MSRSLVAGRVAGARSGRCVAVLRGVVAVGLTSILAGCHPATITAPAPTPSGSGGGATGDPTSATSGGGGSGGSAYGGPTWTCDGDAAYRATSTAFTSPTAEALALALNELVFGYEARPIAIVLHQAGPLRQGVASATTDASGLEQLVAPAPALGALDETAEGFGNAAPQAYGSLTLVQPSGPLSVALEEVRWRVRPNDGCGSIWASLDAVIPATEGGKVLHLQSSTASIADLATPEGGPDGGLAGYPIHAWFLGESMPFDFTSLPVPP